MAAPVHRHHTRHHHLHWHTGSGMGNTGQQWAVYRNPAMQCQLSSLSVRIVTSVHQAVIHSVVRQTWSSYPQLELKNTQPMIWSWSSKGHSLPKTHMIYDICYEVCLQSFRIFLWSNPIIFANVISMCSIYDYINKHVKQHLDQQFYSGSIIEM